MKDDAQEHFFANQLGTADKRARIAEYAIDELLLDEPVAEAYACKVEEELDPEGDADDLGDFYTWYYINYVAMRPRSRGLLSPGR